MLTTKLDRAAFGARRWIAASAFLLGVAAFALPDTALAQTVSRGPYLQMGAPTSMTVRWRTNSATDSVVRYGPSANNLPFVAQNGGNRTEHEVALDGLDPATTYFYSVGNSSGPLAGGDADHKFITSPPPGTEQPTRIWVVGDSGEANASARAVRDAYLNLTGDQYTNLFLMLGDNAYDSGTDSEYQAAVFNTYPSILRQTPVWPTLGNHDGRSANSNNESGVYYNIFTLPRNAEIGGVASGTEAYYSFDYANIHFVVLESFETNRGSNSPMMNWLRDDVAAQDQPWVIAFWHHPPYSKGSHDSDSETGMVQMRQNALPILESAGVDLVLTGHSHSYERSFLIDGHYGNSGSFNAGNQVDDGDGRVNGDGAYEKPGDFIGDPNQGAVYIVAGSSSKISGGSLNHRAMRVSLNRLGSMVLEVEGDILDATFLDNNGNARDTFRISKTGVSTELPRVTVVASDASASEAGLDGGAYTVSRSGDTTAALSVRYTVSGTATAGSDYQALSGTATIAAGQVTATVAVTPIDDPDVESDETVSLALSADAAYTVGSPSNATVTIASDDVGGNLPVVSLSVVRGTAAEAGLSRGRFRLDRTGNLSAALTVRYSVGGTATAGSDYRALSGSKTIKAGKSRTWFDIVPLDDGEVEADETVVATLSADAAYEVGSPASGTVTVTSDDVGGGLPVVSIAVSDGTATEAGPTSGAFTVSRTGDSSAALTVNYGTGGTATSGDDYAALGGSVTLAAGATSASISVDPVDDTDVEADETVVVSLSAGSAYQVGSPASGTVTIASDDVGGNLPVVTITLLRDGAEAGRSRGRVRLDRTGALGQGLTVRYSVGGTATSGDDFRALSGEKRIKSGKDRNWIDIVPVNDTAAEGDESVVLTILPDPAYQVGAAGSVTINIADNDQNDQQAAAAP